MIPEDTVKLIQMRRNPVNSLQDLNKKLVGTREGFIFYTTNFRKDFDTKMAMLGRLEEENQQLKIQISAREEVANKLQSTLEEIREVINQPFPSYASCIKAIDEIEYIIDKGKWC